MSTRREFVKGAGLAAFFLGLSKQPAHAALARRFAPRLAALGSAPSSLARSAPIVAIPDQPAVVDVEGFPFSPQWLGDPFPHQTIPFHHPEDVYPGGVVPPPDEDVDLAIVGGGLSGLALAYFLREHDPVLFDLHDRFGGVSKGEDWRGTRFSMGGAYFIQPDADSWLARFYTELGLDANHRYSAGGDDPIEVEGLIRDGFWDGAGLSASERHAFELYARLVQYYVERYPDIPLVEGRDNAWILALDQKTLFQLVQEAVGGPIPRLLAAGVDGYCYSSFNAGWDSVSAAAGMNFLAAEEYGRWVCPGGNAYVTDELWRRLVAHHESRGVADRIRPSTRVVAVDVGHDGRALVTYQRGGTFRTLRAKRVAMCGSKHIVKHVLKDVYVTDPTRVDAMNQVFANPYLVANVLLDAPIALDFYDLFLLEDGEFPFTDQALETGNRVTDVIAGGFPGETARKHDVLTMYWPLPWQTAPFELLADEALLERQRALVPHLRRVLALLGIQRSNVRAIRMTRWGHAMPVARPRFLADGVPQKLRAPWRDAVWFVNQDNWALPAFETCLIEAHDLAPRIAAGL